MFKVDDKVECIDVPGNGIGGIQVGRIYTIKTIDGRLLYFYEIYGGWLEERFKLAETHDIDYLQINKEFSEI